MTLLFCDSFDYYTTVLQKWTTTSGGSITNNGRNGTDSMRFSQCTNYSRLVLDSTYQTLTAGVAFKITLIGDSGRIISFNDSASYQCECNYDILGHLTITRNGTVLATSTGHIMAETWYYIEFQATIDDAPNGQAILKVNGTTWASVVNGDTKNTVNAYTNVFQLHGGADSSFNASYYDDLYLCDDAGGFNDDFLGDVRVECIMPEGAGATTDWDPSAGANWECVDEIPPDSDTTYVSTATATEVDTYEFGDVTPTTGTVLAVVTYMFARKDDAGARVINSVVRPVATDYASGASHSVGDSYAYYPDLYEENEEVAGVWTIATVNASEFGIKLES